MYSESIILDLKSKEAWSKISKFAFATLVSQTNRCSPIDEKGDDILPV